MKKVILAIGALMAVSSAIAADLPRARRGIPAQVMAPAPIASQPAHLYWTGGYVGAHLGYGFKNEYTGSNAWGVASGSGVLGGLQAGYDWQFNQFIAGLAADISLTSMSASNVVAQGNVDWTGSVRARLGFLVTDRMMVYGTAGFAAGGVKIATAAPIANERKALAGYTMGAGAEYAFTQNLSALLEYRYTSLSRAGYGSLGGVSYDSSFHTIRTGIN